MSKLCIIDGAMEGSSFDLTNHATLVGRASGNDIRVKDPSVSRKHMKILRKGDRFLLREQKRMDAKHQRDRR